jgi:hypothetical protein
MDMTTAITPTTKAARTASTTTTTVPPTTARFVSGANSSQTVRLRGVVLLEVLAAAALVLPPVLAYWLNDQRAPQCGQLVPWVSVSVSRAWQLEHSGTRRVAGGGLAGGE